jgi:hypothetical protein
MTDVWSLCQLVPVTTVTTLLRKRKTIDRAENYYL